MRFLSVWVESIGVQDMICSDDRIIKIVWGCHDLNHSFETMPYSCSSYDLETLKLHTRFLSLLLDAKS